MCVDSLPYCTLFVAKKAIGCLIAIGNQSVRVLGVGISKKPGVNGFLVYASHCILNANNVF